VSNRSVSRRPNGHDTAQRQVDNAAEPRCPYCGQEIVGGQDQADEILARIENTERARLARQETALKQQFMRQQQQAQTKVKAEIAKAVREATATTEKKLKLVRDQQAGVVAAAVSTEKLQHAAEKLRLESALADMQRKLAAKPAYAIGEPAELDLYDAMVKACPDDVVTRVRRGTRGPDVRIQVCLGGNTPIGSIILDSKVHARWSGGFTTKLRADQIAEGADFAILSTTVFPAGAHELHLQDGVIVSSPQRVPVLVQLLRREIVEHHRLKLTTHARDERAEALLAYIVSPACGDLLDRLHAATDALIDIEVKEVSVHQATWRKRGELLRAVQKTQEDLIAAFDAITSGADPVSEEASA
jgi:hypothetical protein